MISKLCHSVIKIAMIFSIDKFNQLINLLILIQIMKYPHQSFLHYKHS